MPRQIVLTVLILLTLVLVVLPPRSAAAQPAGPDPTAYLPKGTMIVKTASGDVDGDGRDDIVVLYSVRTSGSNITHAGLLILQTTDDGVRPLHLFGAPPNDLRQEPTLDPNGSTDLARKDLIGDGRPETVLTGTNTFPEPMPPTLLCFVRLRLAPERADDALAPARS